MSESKIAIVGSGIVGVTAAYWLTRQGHDVVIFEKGAAYPYPHTPQWMDNHLHYYDNPAYHIDASLKSYTSDGIGFDLERERYMRVGGSATVWEAITIRMMAEDFWTNTLYGYGDDWAVDYDALEPYYGAAETLLGVAGTDDDNPFAPPRSMPYPLPPFDLAYDDTIMQERLLEAGITLHTTPQARTRLTFDSRPGCQNYGTCRYCPIGARYSPNHHLQQAVQTGLCTVQTNISVRRVIPDADGQGATLVYQPNDGGDEQEHHSQIVIVAAGALESARLLLLSRNERFPDGVGNAGGQVGQGLAFHHVWKGRMQYDEALYPFRFGGWTGQSLQFINTPTRGEHAAVKVEFASRKAYEPPMTWETALNLRDAMQPQLHWQQIVLQAEAPTSPEKYVTLSDSVDRFGDPFAHVHYHLTEFDANTYDFSRRVFDQFVAATRPAASEFPPMDFWDSGSHHMGTCRMGTSPDNSVVNVWGQVHGAPSVFVLGGSSFVGSSGAVNPTLTMVALAIRSAGYILDQLV